MKSRQSCLQSRTQSLQAFWSAGQRREDSGDIDFCGKTMETVTEQPIKKIEFFRCPGVAPLTKKPEDSGYEIVLPRDLFSL